MSRDASVSGGKHDTRARRRVEFWSSVECAAFQRALVVALESRGCATGVRFVISQQAYWGTRSRLARLVLHCRSFLLYPARLAARRANRAAIVCTNPFLAPWVAVRTASARAPVIHWVFDLYPDVLLVAGKVRRGGFRERVIRRLVRDTFDRARVNVFLGERLRQYAGFDKVPQNFMPLCFMTCFTQFGKNPLQ